MKRSRVGRRLGLVVVGVVVTALTVAAGARAADVRTEGPNWILENESLLVRLEPRGNPEETARLEVKDKRNGIVWGIPADANWRVTAVARDEGGGLRLDVSGWSKGEMRPLSVSLALDGADLKVVASADPALEIDRIVAFPALILDQPGAALAVADYSNGHLYPLDLDPFPGEWQDGGRMDMPWVGLLDPATGGGCVLILGTPDDAAVQTRGHKQADGTTRRGPWVLWGASHGTFAYPREAIYRFTASGGHVALAKAYRAYARELGLLVTLEEKARKNPNVSRLFGATDVWGGSLEFAEEAKAAGLDRLIVSGRHQPEAVERLNELGYLTSPYDNYTDIEPLKDPSDAPDSNHDRVPEHVVLKADGERMTAWLTYDKKTQFMKRCPSLWTTTAKAVIPASLARWPELGRFIDVTTAEALYECHDPAHPLTHRQKREAGIELLDYVRSLGLVVGGEHGIWWAVPYTDYFEGMMSHNPSFAWPAGHLIRPKSRTEKYEPAFQPGSDWARYDRDGIGHETRVPLWELVFHDCVVTTWYWGDSSDFLNAIDPAYQSRKDAFNVLYGTMPMLWAGREGSWSSQRERFIQTAKQVGDATRTVATAEMLTHEWLTPDRAVQRTTFSNGVEAVVNFGEEAREVEVQGRKATLPPYGYLVRGPGVDILGPTP